MSAARRIAFFAVPLLLTAAACGSTVPAAQRSTASGMESATSPAEGAATAGAALQSTESGNGTTADQQGSSGSTASAPVTSVESPPTRPIDGRAGAPAGTTLSTIKLGLEYSTSANVALQAIGGTTATADAKALGDALVSYVNKTGGIAGHRVVPAYYNINAYDSPQTISQTECTQWTQDDHVMAAVLVSAVSDTDTSRTCLGSAGVLGVQGLFYSRTTATALGRSPLWFELGTLRLEQWARIYAAGLAQQGFFKGARVGLVYDDGATFTQVVNQVLLPALAEAGAHVVATATESIHGVGDLQSGSTQMSSAVLKFRGANVDRVLFFEVWEGYFLFLQNAHSQNYHPRYGLTSQNAVQIDIESGLIPTDELVGSRLVSWNPGVDLTAAAAGSWPRKAECVRVLSRAGLSPDAGNTLNYSGALSECGAVLFLQDAGRLVRGPLTSASLAEAAQRLGDRAQAGELPTASITAAKHDAVSGWRPGSYDKACTCFRYTGPLRTL